MSAEPMRVGQSFIVESQHLEQLLEALTHRGYEVIGPTICEGAIVYQALTSIKDLPAGWTDQQQGGRYRLRQRSDGALFGYVVGPQSWKKYLYQPLRRLWHAERKSRGFRIVPDENAGAAVRLPWCACLRTPRHRDSGPGVSARYSMLIRTTKRGARVCSSWRSIAPSPAAIAFAHR